MFFIEIIFFLPLLPFCAHGGGNLFIQPQYFIPKLGSTVDKFTVSFSCKKGDSTFDNNVFAFKVDAIKQRHEFTEADGLMIPFSNIGQVKCQVRISPQSDGNEEDFKINTFVSNKKLRKRIDFPADHNVHTNLLVIRSIVQCPKNKYGMDCGVSCRETNNEICDKEGNRQCKKGYERKNGNCFKNYCMDMYKWCKNNGNCSYNEDLKIFLCDCPETHTGVHCERKLTPCEQKGCLNGGSCLLKGSSERICRCPDKWAGDMCEVNATACKALKCSTRRCHHEPGGHTCDCENRLYGPKCELDIDECKSKLNPCKHSGKCVNKHGGFDCICKHPYTGPTCEKCAVYKKQGKCQVGNEDKMEKQQGIITGVIGVIIAMLVICLPVGAILIYKLWSGVTWAQAARRMSNIVRTSIVDEARKIGSRVSARGYQLVKGHVSSD